MLGLALLGGAFGQAGARSVAIGGVVQAPAVDSKPLAGGEMLAVWTLPRLGVSVRNDPRDTRLKYGSRELRYAPSAGWQAVGFKTALNLPAPQSVNGSLYVPLSAVKTLGIRLLAEAPDVLDFAAPAVVPSVTLPPSAEDPAAPSPVVATAKTPLPPKAVATVPSTPKPPVAQVSTPPKVPVTAPVANLPRPAPTPPKAVVTPVPTPPVTPPITPQAPSPAAVTPLPEPAPPTPPVVPQPAQPIANLDTIRVSHTLHRNVQVRRVVLELSGPAPQTISREKAGLSILLNAVTASAVNQTFETGDSMTVTPSTAGATVRLSAENSSSEIFTLDNPNRVVIDTTTLLNNDVPPPIDPDNLPEGVTYTNKGTLHLLSFDPARFQAQVVSAPSGRFNDIASLVKSVQGVAGVNGGYFDPASALPVDLVVKNGLMVAPSLERRATVGFTATGDALFGYPKPRYMLSGPFGSLKVNTVGSKVRRDLLQAFVGDGQTAVGADDLTTLYVSLGSSTVQSALTGRVVPPVGTLALTFDSAKFPQLPRAAGAALTTSLTWRADDAPWDSARDALSAGPLLVSGGKVALNPSREMFDTSAGIWRPTRQVALGTLGGKPTIAYFEYGTPESFAAALAGAGVRDAIRMDSGSSASAYLTGGYANLGGYLNTVWSQRVPNAIVFVPKAATAKK